MKNKVSLIVSPLLMYVLLLAINAFKMYIASSMNYTMGVLVYFIYILCGIVMAWFLFECNKCTDRKLLNITCGLHVVIIFLMYIFMLFNLQYMISDYIHFMCVMMGIVIAVLIKNNIKQK